MGLISFIQSLRSTTTEQGGLSEMTFGRVDITFGRTDITFGTLQA